LYARKRYGVTHFVIDSLAKCGIAEDDYKGQKDFVDNLCDFAMENNIHIHLVVHIRKGRDELTMPDKFDIKGTGALTDMASNVFVVWRNKIKERILSNQDHKDYQKALVMPDCILHCVKNRETGEEPTIRLWFDKGTCQFLESSTSLPFLYLHDEIPNF